MSVEVSEAMHVIEHAVPRQRSSAKPQKGKLVITPEPTAAVDPIGYHSITTFIREVHDLAKASGDKWPVPLVGQTLYKPATSRKFGYVYTALLFDWADAPLPDEERSETLGRNLATGRLAFDLLDKYREGPESTIPDKKTAELHHAAEQIDTVHARVGRQVLQALQDAQATHEYRMARDAYFAIALYAESGSRVAPLATPAA